MMFKILLYCLFLSRGLLPALHAELVQMAEDSLTWGSYAARTALNMYAGTHYTIWYAGDGGDEASGLNRAAPTPVAASHTLLLAPNPSDGQVTVTYTLPAAAQAAEVVIYDAWGAEVLRRSLNGKQTTAELRLALRAGLYNAVLLADGALVAKERLLIEQH
jgi:hypothetical protein